jgi:hypothetical protein
MKKLLSVLLSVILSVLPFTSHSEDVVCVQTKTALANDDPWALLSRFQTQTGFDSAAVTNIQVVATGPVSDPECSYQWTYQYPGDEWTAPGYVSRPPVGCFFGVLWISVLGIGIVVVYTVVNPPQRPPPGGYHHGSYTNSAGKIFEWTDEPPLAN